MVPTSIIKLTILFEIDLFHQLREMAISARAATCLELTQKMLQNLNGESPTAKTVTELPPVKE